MKPTTDAMALDMITQFCAYPVRLIVTYKNQGLSSNQQAKIKHNVLMEMLKQHFLFISLSAVLT